MNKKIIPIVGLGAGAVVLTGYGGSVLMNMEPNAITLEILDKSEKYKDNKISEVNKVGGNETNKKYLVANIEENKDWWDWSFRNRYQKVEDSEKKDLFKNITRGYGKEAESLGKKCEEAYKKEKNNINGTLENISKFCTTGMKGEEKLVSESQ